MQEWGTSVGSVTKDPSSAPQPRQRLIVLFGGQSAEHDVSCTSVRHVLAALDPAQYHVEPIGITRDGTWVRAEAAIAALAGGPEALPAKFVAAGPEVQPALALAAHGELPPVVLPILHGPQGEDGTMQGLLELMNVPYVGSGVLASAMAMDKIKAKEAFHYHQVPQARWRGFNAVQWSPDLLEEIAEDLGYPVFVKPANMGSSVGVTKATTADAFASAVSEALRYDEWVVVEEAVVGREIECAVLGNLDPEVSVPGEILTGADWYDYEDKYDNGAQLVIPAPLEDGAYDAMVELATRAYKALRCEGLARVDFFYETNGRGWLVNEVNTMPGFTPISMYPKMWEASGLGYSELIDRLVALAIERFHRRIGHRDTNR